MQKARALAPFPQIYRKSCVGMDVALLPDVSQDSNQEGDSDMLWTILVILLVLWLIGLLGGIGGNLVHLLLVIAVVVLVINLVTGRRAV